MPIDTRTVLVAFGVDCAIGVGCATLFSVLRIAKPTRAFYAPQRDKGDINLPGQPPPEAPNPPPLPLTLLTWVYPLLRISEKDIIKIAGLDVAIYLRVIRFGLQLAFFLCLWCLVVVLPINITGTEVDTILADQAAQAAAQLNQTGIQLGPGQVEDLAQSISEGRYVFSNIDKLSMANISPGSPRLWAHLVSVYVVTFITLRLLWRFSRAAIELRFMYMAQQPVGGPSHAVMVTDIPGVAAGTLLDLMHRIVNRTILKVLPGFVKRPVEQAWRRNFLEAEWGWRLNIDGLVKRWAGNNGEESTGMPGSSIRSVTQLATPGNRSRRSTTGDEPHVYVAAKTTSAGAGREQQQYKRHNGPQELFEDGSMEMSSRVGRVSEMEGGNTSDSAAKAAAEHKQELSLGTEVSPVTAGVTKELVQLEAEKVRGEVLRQRHRRHQEDGNANDGQQEVEVTVGADGERHGRGSFCSPADSRSSSAHRAAVREEHDEWHRATNKLRQGLSFKDMILEEFQEAYGHGSVAQVHPVVYSKRLAALETRYSNKKQQLEDLLNQYELMLQRAGRHKGLLAKLWDCCIGGPMPKYSSDQRAGSQPPKPIPVKQMRVPSDWPCGDLQPGPMAAPGMPAPTAACSSTGTRAASKISHQGIAGAPTREMNALELTSGPSEVQGHVVLVQGDGLPSEVTNGDNNQVSSRNSNLVGSSSAQWKHSTGGAAKVHVDILTYRLGELGQLVQKIGEAQKVAEQRPLPAAFVTFNTRSQQVVAATTLQNSDESCWRSRAAPSPDDVVWSNMRLRLWEVTTRQRLVLGVLVVIVLFYTIPVSAVQAWLQLDRLERTPVIKDIVAIPFVRSILLGVLPGLALRLFVLLLPILLYAVNNHAGYFAISDVDFAVSTQYFVVQLFTVFVSSFLSGSILNQIQGLIKNPQGILTTLGTGVPQTASFFILYIIFVAFVGRSFALLRPFGLIIYIIQISAAATERARRRAARAQYRGFGPIMPNHTITLLLSLVFCIINPLILVAALANYCTAVVVERYGWVYAYRRWYESGGRLWRQVFIQVMTAVYLFQVVMLALLAVKKFVFAPLLLPVILVTFYVHRAAMKLFSRPWDLLSLRDARRLDHTDAEASSRLLSLDDQLPSELERGTANNASIASLAVDLEVRTSYVPSSFKTDFDAQLQELAGEVKDLLGRLEAHNAMAGGQPSTAGAPVVATV